jgi:hypothetical protein
MKDGRGVSVAPYGSRLGGRDDTGVLGVGIERTYPTPAWAGYSFGCCPLTLSLSKDGQQTSDIPDLAHLLALF